MLKSLSFLSASRVLIRLCAVIALAASTSFVAWILYGPLGVNETYLIVLRVLAVVLYLLLVPSAILAIIGRVRSRFLRYGLLGIAAISVVVLGFLGSGVLQDLGGVRCTDFWGWSELECSNVMRSWVFYYLLYPYIFVPVTLIVSGLLVFGLADNYRKYRVSAKRRA